MCTLPVIIVFSLGFYSATLFFLWCVLLFLRSSSFCVAAVVHFYHSVVCVCAIFFTCLLLLPPFQCICFHLVWTLARLFGFHLVCVSSVLDARAHI